MTIAQMEQVKPELQPMDASFFDNLKNGFRKESNRSNGCRNNNRTSGRHHESTKYAGTSFSVKF